MRNSQGLDKAQDQSTNHTAITAVTCLALATVVAAMASLNVALPSIAAATHASQTRLEWIIDAYSLMFAALLLPAGAIGDRYGRRRALLVGLAIFGAGSLAATQVTSSTGLIALRGLLGIGASLVMPATLSTITGTFPPAARTKAVGMWAAVAGGSAVVGLLASGLLLEAFSWRSVFVFNVVLAAIAIAGTLRVVPESADPDAPRLDSGGATLAVVALVLGVFTIIEAPDQGWLAWRTLGGLAVAGVTLALFIAYELRATAPMLDPRLFRMRAFSAGSLSIFIQFFAFFGFTFIMLQYLQIIRGDSALLAAVSVLPMAGAMMPTARNAPKLVARFGSRRVCVTGLLLLGAGLVILAQQSIDSPYWLTLAGLVPLGIGMGAAMTPATTAITESLPSSQQGVGSAMNDLSRELGGALGIAALGSVLASSYRSNLTLPGAPAAIVTKAQSSIAVAQHLGGNTAVHAHTAFVDGLHLALLCAAGVVSVMAGVVAVMLRPKPAGRSAGADERIPSQPMSPAVPPRLTV